MILAPKGQVGTETMVSKCKQKKAPHALEQRQAGGAEDAADSARNPGGQNPASERRKYRNLALSNLAIDSKPRAFDLLRPRVSEVPTDSQVHRRATVSQQKTRRTIDHALELSEQTDV